jgi:hypothetical protein
MQRKKTVSVLAAGLTLWAALAIGFQWLNAQGGKTDPKLGHPAGHAFTDADRDKIKAAALAQLAAEHKGDVIRALHVSSHAVREGKETPENLQKHEAQALVFNYTKGKAFRVDLDPQTGKVLRQEEVQGMILSSREERAEGKKLVADYAEHAKLIKAGSLVEGGFAVQTPKDIAATKVPHRYLEYHLTSADNKTLERVVIVDLSDKKVVSSKAL